MSTIHEPANGFTLRPSPFELNIVVGQKSQKRDFNDYANFCALS